MWGIFVGITSHMWVFVQFWVASTIFAKITSAIMITIFGPLKDGHLDLMGNRDSKSASRWVSNAAFKGKKSLLWELITRFLMLWVRLCEIVLSISRGILGVDKP